MVSKGTAAYEAARKAVESTYHGVMTVTEMKKVKDEKSKLTKDVPEVVCAEEPCRLSFESLQAAEQSETYATVKQEVKLFTSPDILIREGSKITVTQNKVTADYARSGIPAIYETHQEIFLQPFRSFA